MAGSIASMTAEETLVIFRSTTFILLLAFTSALVFGCIPPHPPHTPQPVPEVPPPQVP